MSKKQTSYSSAFKTKLVLELLQNESTLAEIASKHNILTQNLVNWKKTFLANAEIAMEPSKAVKDYKTRIRRRLLRMFYIRNFKKLSEVLG